MKTVLLIGLGKFGRHIANELVARGNEILCVDQNEDRVNAILSVATSAIIGDTTNTDFVSSLGVKNFDTCIVAIGDNFQSSLETTALLKDLGAKRIIARACNDVHEKFLLRNGADQVIYPEKQLAVWTAIRCTSDNILDYIQLDDEYSIFEVAVPRGWNGKTVLQLDVRKRYNLNILGIRQENKINMNITPDTTLCSGQSVLVLGNARDVQRCFKI